jgi:uncharacterized membrane-anchored protein YjiN (DUF445 family)
MARNLSELELIMELVQHQIDAMDRVQADLEEQVQKISDVAKEIKEQQESIENVQRMAQAIRPLENADVDENNSKTREKGKKGADTAGNVGREDSQVRRGLSKIWKKLGDRTR